MRDRFQATLLIAGFLLLPTQTRADTPPACAALKGKQRTRAEQLLETHHGYDCCEQPLASCLRQKRVCRLVYRLAQNICRRVAAGQSVERIARALDGRSRTMQSPGNKASFELEGYPAIGPAKAPITVVEYACASCPFCGVMTPALHDAVGKPPLAGTVRLVFKPFPIRSHAHSKESNLGLMAAARLAKFWPFMQKVYANFASFSDEAQLDWAESVGIDRTAFAKQLANGATRKALVASKKEGLRNGVDATPALFINGRRYRGEHQVDEVLDVLQEQAERAKGLVYR